MCEDLDVSSRSFRINQVKIYLNVVRHWRDVHSEGLRVLEIENTVDPIEKRKLITKLRGAGDQYFNHKTSESAGTF